MLLAEKSDGFLLVCVEEHFGQEAFSPVRQSSSNSKLQFKHLNS
jgi:hypothetical protein